MANQILAGAVFQAGQVLAGIDADNILDTFIAPSTTSSTVANRLFMFSSDYANSIYTTNGVDNDGSTSHGGLLMTDTAFANPLTLSSKSPQSVAGGEGKVVSIDYQGEISVYDSSTGALETTFNDTLLDNAKTSSLNHPANSCVIGAGKIFINSHEHNPNGVGSIIVVDLLDRNVPSFLITPALGNYSRLGSQSFGKIQFIDGKIHAGTSPFSAADMGIHSFDPDGSNHTFIPTTFAPLCIVKFGDNYVVSNEDHGVEIISPTGQVLHSKQIGSNGFGRDIDVTSTNKLVVRRQISQYDQAVYIYDEGFTNEIIISQGDQPNTSGGTTPADALWLSEARENSGGLQTINGDILVAAPNASSDTVNQSGAIYRYNDSGVLQEIFYGTVAGQRLGTDITVGTETSTTALPSFIAPPTSGGASTSRYVVVSTPTDSTYGSGAGAIYVFDANNLSAEFSQEGGPTKIMPLDSISGGQFGTMGIHSTSDKLFVAAANDNSTSNQSPGLVYVYDVNDLSAQPTKLTAFDAAANDQFGHSIATTENKVIIGANHDDDDGHASGSFYVFDSNDLSATPTKITAFDAIYDDEFSFALEASGNTIVSSAWKKKGTGNIERMGAVYVYDANDLSATPTKLTAFDAAAYDQFGSSIAITSDNIFVGSGGDNNSSGSIYVYDINDLSATPTKLTASDGANNDWFAGEYGMVSTSEKLIVSSRYDGAGDYHNAGSVYVYDLNDLTAQPTKVYEPLPWFSNQFGKSVDGLSDKFVVGSPYANYNGQSNLYNDSGAAYVYDANDLSAQPTEISLKTMGFPNTFATGKQFGMKVCIVPASAGPALPAFIAPPPPPPPPPASLVVVGVVLDDDDGNNSGSVYVYDANDLSATPTKLTAFDAATNDQFGVSVATAADKIVVAAHQDDDNGSASGSVYVYDANDLSAQPTKLTAFDGAASDYFGMAVATAADKIVVGAYQDDDNESGSGSVYVFDANDLSAQPTKLTAFDAAANDRYGTSVAATSDKIFVGAYYDDDNGDNSGSVYVYDANNLSAQPTKLTAFDGALFEYFGYSVATAADTIVVGAFGDADGGSASGSVYVYDANNLSAQPTKLTAFDPAAYDQFGYSVAVTDDKIVVGARQDDDNGYRSGSVYVYDANDLSAQPTKLTAFDGAAGDGFGYSVAVTDDKIFVGAHQDDDNGDNSGSVYVYDANDLSAQPTKLTAFDGAASDFFGYSIAAG